MISRETAAVGMSPYSRNGGIAVKSDLLKKVINSGIAALLIASAAAVSYTVPIAESCPCDALSVPANVNESEFSAKIGLDFARTPQYAREFQEAINGATAEINRHIGEKGIAIVSDIDETILDNRPFFEEHEQFNWQDFFAWVEQAQAPSLRKTTDMLMKARKQGVAIFLITGRMEKLRKGTIQNLVRNNIAYDGLYMRPDGDRSSAAEFKSGVRKKIEEMGFKVIVNVGDQFSDLEGGYSKECAKLPNKLYYIK